MTPSPVGAFLELGLGLLFLVAAVVAARTGSSTRRVAIDLAIGVAAVADAAGARADGPLRAGLWIAAGTAVLVAAAVLAASWRRRRPSDR